MQMDLDTTTATCKLILTTLAAINWFYPRLGGGLRLTELFFAVHSVLLSDSGKMSFQR